MDHPVLRDHKVMQDNLGLPDHKDHKVHREYRDQQVTLVLLVLLGHKDRKVTLVHKVSKA